MRYFQECPACNEKAFEYKKKPKKGAPVKATNAIHKNNPKKGDFIECEQCDNPIPEFCLHPDFLITEK